MTTTLARLAVTLFTILILSSIVLFYFSKDDGLTKNTVATLYPEIKNIDDSHNAAFAIIGLTAPEDENNIHHYGKVLIKDSILDNAQNNHQRAFVLSNREDELKLEIADGDLMCWGWLEEIDSGNSQCELTPKIRSLVKINDLLLDRYQTLHSYDRFRWDILTSRNDNILIPLNLLFLAKMKMLDQDNKKEEEIELLLKNIAFWKNLAQEPTSIIIKSIAITILRHNLNFTKNFIRSNADSFYNLNIDTSVFKSIGLENYNLKNSLITEFAISELKACLDQGQRAALSRCDINNKFFYKRNKTANNIYQYIQELLKTTTSAYSSSGQLKCEISTEFGEYDNLWIDRHVFNKIGSNLFAYYKSILNAESLCGIANGIYQIDADLQFIGNKKNWGQIELPPVYRPD